MWGHFRTLIILSIISLSSAGIFTIENSNAQEPNYAETPIFFDFTMNRRDSPDRVIMADLIQSSLLDIGINMSIEFGFLDRSIFYDRTNVNRVPLNDEGGFDTTLISWNVNPGREGAPGGTEYGSYGANFFPDSFTHTDGVPNMWNYMNFISDEYNLLQSQYFNELNAASRDQIFRAMVELLDDELPIIPLVDRVNLQLYNNEIGFNQTLDDVIQAISFNELRSGWQNLEIENKAQIAIGRSGFRSFDMSPFSTGVFSSLAFQGLYERVPGELTSWQPLLAESMPTWNPEQTIAKIKIKEGITFADGHNLTAFDVKESYRWYLSNLSMDRSQTYSEFIQDFSQSQFTSNDSIRILNDYTLEFTFAKPYIYPIIPLSFNVFPIHLYGTADKYNVSNGDLRQHFESIILDDVVANGTSPYLQGSGPFQSSDLNLTANVQTFSSVDNYWAGVVKTSQIKFYEYFGSEYFEDLNDGTIDFMNRPFDFDRDDLSIFTNIGYKEKYFVNFDFMPLNLDHPWMGTGELTPVGVDNPSQAKTAAKNIRHAINCMVPRQEIIDTVFAGYGDPANSFIHKTEIHYPIGFQTCNSDISAARGFMEAAGFEYPIITSSSSSSSTTKRSDDGFLDFVLFHQIFIPLIVALLVLRPIRNKKFASNK
ncbi:MAG: hypothetical protein HeimC2_37110 [Candidatus Heimdallarchaeota archaeon LC_2]|nr:MAG: hypothetical protein HeimC2_37110 [Candidatus Heimdallarchaeota archaeon LC_2]